MEETRAAHAGQCDGDDESLRSYEVQPGVKNIEVISQTWTTSSLISAYIGYVTVLQIFFTLQEPMHATFPSISLVMLISTFKQHESHVLLCSSIWPTLFSIFLLACVTSLEGQTTVNLTVYATSAFSLHSLVSTVYVVQGVVNGAWMAAMVLVDANYAEYK